jgi:hypothetical protein
MGAKTGGAVEGLNQAENAGENPQIFPGVYWFSPFRPKEGR